VTESEANKKRGEVLRRLLEDYQPDFVCLLETGTAINANQHIQKYVDDATGTPDYSEPFQVLERDASKTDHDKGIVAFWRDTIQMKCQVYPRSDSNRVRW